MRVINTIALVLTIIGGINWGLWGVARVDIVSLIIAQSRVPVEATAVRIVFMAIGVAALWCIGLVGLVAKTHLVARRTTTPSGTGQPGYTT